MKLRGFDPRRLDVAAFAKAGGQLSGAWPLAQMPRLLQDALPLGVNSPAQGVEWSAIGECRPEPGAADRIVLRLHAATVLDLVCQRCLQPVAVPLELRPTLRFVAGEAQAEALDEHSDDDVLALTAALDLHELVEDELILALPLVPRHERCPASPAALAEPAAQAGHPFAALAALRRGAKGD